LTTRTFAPALLALLGLAMALPRPAPAQGPQAEPAPTTRETPGLRSSQVSIAIEKDGKRRQFRATVMARKDDLLTVLTAAHCVEPDDEGGPALLLVDGEIIEGTVASVVRNPAYRPNQPREIPGPDNAVARLRFKAEPGPAADALGSIRPALGLANRAYPGPAGQVVAVRMVDGHGVEHAVKAGNHSNPRWLEWGPAYKPIPGDSGGGVFVLAGSPEPRPILIGIIVGRDDKGGGASLVSRDMRWIAEELAR